MAFQRHTGGAADTLGAEMTV